MHAASRLQITPCGSRVHAENTFYMAPNNDVYSSSLFQPITTQLNILTKLVHTLKFVAHVP